MSTTPRIRAAIAAGVTEGKGLRLVESAGAVLVVVPTPRGEVIVAHDGKWREGFEDGPWVEALDALLSDAAPADTRSMKARKREHAAAVKAVDKAMKKDALRG